MLEIEGFRERIYASLRTLASQVAERVANTGRSVTLEPMASNERRIIHMTLSEHPQVITESTGIGAGRKITISPVA